MHSSGFSLIEVLVSLVLLSLVMFGLDAMEVMALRDTREAYFFSIGSFQLQSMTERLRALGQRQGIEAQVSAWNQENHLVLPEGIGTLVSGVLKICWEKGVCLPAG